MDCRNSLNPTSVESSLPYALRKICYYFIMLFIEENRRERTDKCFVKRNAEALPYSALFFMTWTC